MARRTGDDAALVDAIRLSSETIAMPQTLPLRLRWNREACALADTLGDPTARLHANDYLYLAGLEAGDPETMRIPRAILHAEAERIGQPIYRWVIEYHDALDWMLAGDLDAAERAMTDALTLGAEAGYPEDAVTIYGPQLMTLRWMQGRFHEMVPLIEKAASDSPELEIFRAALAVARVFDDQRDEVRRILDTELANDFQMFADATWLAGQMLWAEAVTRYGHRPAAKALYRTPVAVAGPVRDLTHHGPGGSGALPRMSCSHPRPLRRSRRSGSAQALALHEAMEAPFFVALTQAAWADLLADREQPGDAQRARALAGSRLSRRCGARLRLRRTRCPLADRTDRLVLALQGDETSLGGFEGLLGGGEAGLGAVPLGLGVAQLEVQGLLAAAQRLDLGRGSVVPAFQFDQGPTGLLDLVTGPDPRLIQRAVGRRALLVATCGRGFGLGQVQECARDRPRLRPHHLPRSGRPLP